MSIDTTLTGNELGWNFNSTRRTSSVLKGVRVRVIDENYKHLKDEDLRIIWTSTVMNSKGKVRTFYHVSNKDSVEYFLGLAEYYFGEGQVEIIKE